MDEVDGLKVAGLFDQRVYLSTTNQDSNTYYNLTIMQKGVQDKLNARVALQWLRNMTDLESFDYRGVVIQVYTEFTGSNPTITIQDALNYNVYKSGGGTLDHNEYLNAVLLGDSVGFFAGISGSRFVRNVRALVTKDQFGTEI
jgi:hypothetical protein